VEPDYHCELAEDAIPIIALLLLADSMTHKQPVPETAGTLRTDSLLFTGVTAGVILILVLTFFPVLALGPIAEAFKIVVDSRLWTLQILTCLDPPRQLRHPLITQTYAEGKYQRALPKS